MDHLSEVIVQRCSVKKVFLEILQNSQENTCTRISFLVKEGALKSPACNFIKKVFFCKICAKILETRFS